VTEDGGLPNGVVRNGIEAVRDVAIKDGRIAAVAADIPSTQATRTVDAAGLYVTRATTSG
jgi:predicted amidohydrolase